MSNSVSKDSIDEFFSDNSFYSAHSTYSNPTNHIKNVRNSIQIKSSISSRSLKDSLIDNNKYPSTKTNTTNTTNTKSNNNGSIRTSFMKASPSIKALESLLNKKQEHWQPNIISEEDDEEINNNDNKQLPHLEPSFSYSPANADSFQTFATAEEDQQQQQQHNDDDDKQSTTTKSYRMSESSIAELGYDTTPVLEKPPTVENFTPHSNNSPQLKMIDTTTNINPQRSGLFIQTNVQDLENAFDQMVNNKQQEQSQSPSKTSPPRFIKLPNYTTDHQQKQPQQPQPKKILSNQSTHSPKQSSPLNQQQKLPLAHSPIYTNYCGSDTISIHSGPTSFNVTSPLSKPTFSKHQSTLSTGSQSVFSTSSPNIKKIESLSDSPQSPKYITKPKSMLSSPSDRKPSSPVPEPPASSPRNSTQTTRTLRKVNTNSTSSFSSKTFGSQFHGTPRSRTISDISSIPGRQAPPPPPKPAVLPSQFKSQVPPSLPASAPPVVTQEKKKFSIKSLFKSKSRGHSLNKPSKDEVDYSLPKKLRSKSFSTSMLNELESKPQPSSNNRRSTLFTAFRKNKSPDNVTKHGFEDVKKKEHIVGSGLSPTPPSSASLPSTSVLENSRATGTGTTTHRTPTKYASMGNLIREVNDDDDNDADKLLPPPTLLPTYRQPVSPEENLRSPPSMLRPASYNRRGSKDSQPGQLDEDEDDTLNEKQEEIYDEENLMFHPPKKITTHGIIQTQEMEIIPPLLDSGEFGSPFQVTYSSPASSSTKTTSPRPVVSAEVSRTQSIQRAISPQLLGEALFPKSLNAHEVESIVSLERSRSMKSVRSISIKRSSFVNYDGTDDNIIQYNGPGAEPNPNGMTRSNSILKNSTSRRSNLNQELKNNSNNSIDGNILPAELMNGGGTGAGTGGVAGSSSGDDRIDDLMEFSAFIDVDNLSFSNSPKGVIARSSTPTSPTPIQSPLAAEFFQFESEHASSPVVEEPPKIEISAPPTSKESESTILMGGPTTATALVPEARQETESPIGKSRTPSPLMGDDQEEAVPKSSMEEEVHDYSDNDDKKQQVEHVEIEKQNEHEEQHDISEPDCSPIINGSVLENSPILDSAYRSNGGIHRNRPISMSFKGMHAPSFSGKLNTQPGLRISGSHQSFTISMNDDSSVGGGFGSSSEEDYDDDEDYLSDDQDMNYGNENNFSVRKIGVAPPPPILPRSASAPIPPHIVRQTRPNSLVIPPPPPPPQQPPLARPPPHFKFSHNKIPSISDQSSVTSSPRSLSSMVRWRVSSSTASPTKQQPIEKSSGVRFSSRIILYDTYNGDEYDRHPDTATCNQLTPALAQQIKEELNSFKSEMEIHIESRHYTHFF
ncbi:BNI4 [[Candida] subhashii]|uniref:BNI4 n=1 Tax=[Candida] subhashii TaxID=561895 RepID=A0A8J5QDD2_9ASCO|nr:BNI4 [[Candida] subhashii]KAG7661302.1 BNI4 [[Candida] subhashii]